MAQAAAAATTGKPTSKKKLKALGRKKRILKLRTDKEFAKAYFEARSKRSNDKKGAFRKKKKGK
jgi:hypothetical protein